MMVVLNEDNRTNEEIRADYTMLKSKYTGLRHAIMDYVERSRNNLKTLDNALGEVDKIK